MAAFTFIRSVRFSHHSIPISAINSAIAREARTSWQVGDPHVRKDGIKVGDGIRKVTYWTSMPKKGSGSELLNAIEDDLQWLEPKKSFLDEFNVDGWIYYYVSWIAGKDPGGLTIPHSLLGRLANLEIHLSLDVYAYDEEREAISVGLSGSA